MLAKTHLTRGPVSGPVFSSPLILVVCWHSTRPPVVRISQRAPLLTAATQPSQIFGNSVSRPFMEGVNLCCMLEKKTPKTETSHMKSARGHCKPCCRSLPVGLAFRVSMSMSGRCVAVQRIPALFKAGPALQGSHMRPKRQPGLQPTAIRHFGVASFPSPMLGTEVCLILQGQPVRAANCVARVRSSSPGTRLCYPRSLPGAQARQ